MITLSKVSKSFREVKAVDRVSLEVPDMSSIVIHGPSGSGKTTLLRLIAGLEVPDAGEIFLDEKMVSSSGWTLEPHKRGLGFVFQASALWPHMTVAQNILFGMRGISRGEARNRLNELLEGVSLTGYESRYPHQISGGESRRVALARTLAPQPKIILMDEPLTNLDQALKSDLLAFIKKWVIDTKASLIYVTHDADEAGQITNTVITLRNGCLET
jgi:ABC-type sulfate/molybdate transport systems ATPase subunit